MMAEETGSPGKMDALVRCSLVRFHVHNSVILCVNHPCLKCQTCQVVVRVNSLSQCYGVLDMAVSGFIEIAVGNVECGVVRELFWSPAVYHPIRKVPGEYAE